MGGRRRPPLSSLSVTSLGEETFALQQLKMQNAVITAGVDKWIKKMNDQVQLVNHTRLCTHWARMRMHAYGCIRVGK